MKTSITEKQTEYSLRMGIMVDSVFVDKHIYAFAEWANQQNGLGVSHVIINRPYNGEPTNAGLSDKLLANNGFYNTVSARFFNIVRYFEKQLLKKYRRYNKQYEKLNLLAVVENNLSLRSTVADNDYYAFDDAEINRIKQLDLDIIIKFCGGLFRGDIINSVRLGIISIKYSGDCFNRGYFPGFWEVYSQQDATEFAIKHLSDKSEYGEILVKGQFRTQVFFLLNQAALYEKVNYRLMQLITTIAAQNKIPPYLPSIPYSNGFCDIPKLHQSIAYLINLFYRAVIKILYKLAGYRRQWNVAFVRSGWRKAILRRGVAIKNPPNHFLADPFVISRAGKDYCFIEDYDFATDRGCIVVYELFENSYRQLGVAIAEPFHMSFPYLFEYQGELYMCPETAANKDIRIYKCLGFPCLWQLETVAMSEVAAVDSLLFEKNGKWWMITSIDYIDTGDYAQALSIFYADSPLSGDWQAHPKNPIYIDSMIVRNAGLLKDGERIFRVAQAQGFDVYGKKASIFEIIDINESDFIEVHVVDITPSFKKGIIGTHHFNSNGKVSVFDSLNYAFNAR